MITFLAWTLLTLFVLAGIAGVIIPGLPGTALLFVGAVIHKLILPVYLSWWTVAVLGIGALMAWGLDFAGSLLGAKWGGATKWGLLGAALGGLVGLFFLPIGLLIGPLMGAIVAELWAAKRSMPEAVRSGVGAGVGIVVSMILRIFLTVGLAAWILFDCFFFL